MPSIDPAPNRRSFAKSSRIAPVNRIAPHVINPVHPVAVTDRVGLHEPAERGGVEPRLVKIHPGLGDPELPGIPEQRPAAPERRAEDAALVILILADQGATRVRRRHYRSALVLLQAVGRRQRVAGIPYQRIVHPRSQHIALLDRLASTVIIILNRDPVAIVDIVIRPSVRLPDTPN